jgi:hypothetical protein
VSPAELRRLVRQDVVLVASGVVAAFVCLGLLVSGSVGWLGERHAATAAFAIAIVVFLASLSRWLTGPAELRRDRTLVLIPAFLVAGPALWALRDLGGGLVVAILSGAIGFTAAAVLGIALTSRRR